MKKLKQIFLFAGLLLCLCEMQAQEKYSKIKIYPPQNIDERNTLLGLLQIDHFATDADGGIISEVGAKEIAKLSQTPYNYEILIDDIAAHLREENRRYYADRAAGKVAIEQSGGLLDNIIATPDSFEVKSTFGGYYSFAEMESAMDDLVATYPAIVSKTSIGKTAEGRDLWVIKVSDNVNSDEANEPEILYLGLQHAREAIGGASMIFFMHYLAENYRKSDKIRDLVNNREIFIIPCFNPDGWEYNRTNGGVGSMWRKNRNPVDSVKGGGKNGVWTATEWGVDLNRNWGVDWGNCDAPILGSSTSCGSGSTSGDTYYGANAFSEKETQAVKAFAESHHLVAGFDQHAYGPYYSLPYGRKSLHPEGLPTKSQQFFTAIPAIMGTYNGMRAADSYDALGYEVAGGFKDWMLMGNIGTGSKDTVWAMTGEGGAGGASNSFWPSASQIVRLSKGMCYQNLQLAFAAGSYVDIQDMGNMAVGATSGSFDFTLKRLGLGNEPVTVTMVPLENIQSVGGPVTISSMPVYYDTVVRSISYTLRSGITAGQRIRYIWNVETGGYSYRDTVVKFLNPTILVNDDMEGTLTTNWSATSNVTDNWAFTSAQAFNGSKSLTESPAGNYTSSTTRTIRYTGGGTGVIDLSNATAAYLSFWVKHRAENFRDKLQVQVSTNSTDGTDGTWTAIAGSTTIQEPGTLDNATLNGNPSLTGVRDFWTKETFDLSLYKSANVRFRFVFTSDGDPSSFKFERDEGFFIDDLTVLKTTANLTILPAEFLNFSGRLMPDQSVHLNWEASVDMEHDYFEVERSADGSVFESLGRANNVPPYKYRDAAPQYGNNFYRIKQVDKNGSFSYSKIINIVLQAKLSVAVYPNPANDEVNLKFNTQKPATYQLTVTDIQGRQVWVDTYTVAGGSSEKLLNISKWKPQLYILKVSGADGEVLYTQRIVKL